MESLDPRVQRLNIKQDGKDFPEKPELDQWITYEVFVQLVEDKPFRHEGIVHACDLDMAFILAKEQFTRRYTCSGIAVVATHEIWVSPLTEDQESVLDMDPSDWPDAGKEGNYEVCLLYRRGKQHEHAGQIQANSSKDAFRMTAEAYPGDAKPIYNVWVIPTDKFRFSTPEEKEIWDTLPEKRFREAADYKAGDKLTNFKNAIK